MRAEKIQMTLFAEADTGAAPLDPYGTTFRHWIRRDTLPGLVIDVALHEHVDHGPFAVRCRLESVGDGVSAERLLQRLGSVRA